MKTREDIFNRVAAMFGLMGTLATSVPGASVQGLTIEDIISLAEPTTAEARFIADGNHLNCPQCGGSGHIDDIQPSEDAVQDARRLLSDILGNMVLDDVVQLKPTVVSTISLVADLVHKRNQAVQVMQDLRPLWAQGYTSDSMAAQATGTALAQVWAHLGVDNQTAAMQKLRELKS